MKSVILAIILIAMSACGQFALKACRPGAAPAVAESAIAALGGLRSLAAEVLWFRADRLRMECRYVELAQLASWLTFMEPHTPEVWTYSAWNLAYNISVMMPTFEDRWRWVHAALKLLRDEGLVLNPHEVEIYRELAWMFQLKIGGRLDDAAPLYRRRWREIVDDVSARNAWSELGMRPGLMDEVRRKYRLPESCSWTDPLLSAIYWADQGLAYATVEKDRSFLMELLRQSLHMIFNREESLKREMAKGVGA